MTTFRLAAVEFEGPLDLLLSLIEDKKLDITNVALAEVTQQFLEHVRKLESTSPIVLADYLAVAAKLLVIKSKAILPDLVTPEDEPDAARDLESQLRVYKQYKDIARGLGKFIDKSGQSFVRQSVFAQRVSFFPDSAVNQSVMKSAMNRILTSLSELESLPEARIREAVSIQEKITHLQNMLTESIETRLSHVLSTAKSRHEAIVTFLALLELIKQRILTVEQEASFADITIKRLGAETSVENFAINDTYGSITN